LKATIAPVNPTTAAVTRGIKVVHEASFPAAIAACNAKIPFVKAAIPNSRGPNNAKNAPNTTTPVFVELLISSRLFTNLVKSPIIVFIVGIIAVPRLEASWSIFALSC